MHPPHRLARRQASLPGAGWARWSAAAEELQRRRGLQPRQPPAYRVSVRANDGVAYTAVRSHLLRPRSALSLLRLCGAAHQHAGNCLRNELGSAGRARDAPTEPHAVVVTCERNGSGQATPLCAQQACDTHQETSAPCRTGSCTACKCRSWPRSGAACSRPRGISPPFLWEAWVLTGVKGLRARSRRRLRKSQPARQQQSASGTAGAS